MTRIKPPPPFIHSHLLKPKFFFMASLILLFLFFTFSSSSSSSHHHPLKSPPPVLQQACKATRYPLTCQSTLTQSPNLLPPNPTPLQIIQSSLNLSSQGLLTAQSMAQSILSSSSTNQNRSTAAKNCLLVLRYSQHRLSQTLIALPDAKIKDARAWASASLLYQYVCWSALKYVNNTSQVNNTMAFMDSLIGLTSNALSMIVSYDKFGDELEMWTPPKTERDGVWEQGAVTDTKFTGGFPSGLNAHVTVCKEEGVGCLKTVQEAVDAAPDNQPGRRFVIWIKEGVYEETVRVDFVKKNVVFLGDGMGKTVITGSLNVGQPGISTYDSATVGVAGDGFMARDLTFENTAGPDAHQAVAFRSDSDLSIFENCEFLGNQDTLYAHALRQFYKSCRIEGNVDFIFGNSAAVFQDCLVLIRPRQSSPEKGENNAITAHGRTDPAQSTGFVFQNCLINGTDEYMRLYYSKPKVHRNYLGRPWKEYSRTVFIHCNLEALVTSPGWMPWSGDFALPTLYYGEFENTGPGANSSGRVSWSSQIPKEHVLTYSTQNFIQGNDWINNS